MSSRCALQWTAAACLTGALAALAAEAPRPPTGPRGSRARIYGQVGIQKDTGGKIAAVTVTTVNQIVYKVALDEQGLKLGEQLAGRRATVLGYMAGTGAVRSLTVIRFAEITKQDNSQAPRRPTPRPSKARKRSR
jgi:hypothetical protein